MKKQSLIQLIQSLNKNEKGYIKTHIIKEAFNSKDYILLLDMFLTNSPEKILKETFKKRLPVLKHRLYNLIIDSLIQYNKSYSKTYSVKMKLLEIEVLLDKQQFELCNNKIIDLEEQLQENQNYTAHLELLQFKHSLKIANTLSANFKIENEKDFQTEINILNQMQSIAISKKKYVAMRDYEFTYQFTTNAPDLPLLPEVQFKDIFMENIYNTGANLINYRVLKQKQKAIKLITQFKAYLLNTNLSNVDLNYYLTALSVIMTSENTLKLQKEALKTLDILKNLFVNDSRLKKIKKLNGIRYDMIITELEILFELKQYKKGLLAINSYISKNPNDLSITSEILLCQLNSYSGLCNIMTSNYKQTKRELNSNINLYEKYKNLPFMNLSIIIYLLAYYKTEDFEFISRFLNQKITQHALEGRYSKSMSFWFDFFKKIATYPKHEHSQLIQTTISNFDKKNPQNKELFCYFDIIEFLKH